MQISGPFTPVANTPLTEYDPAVNTPASVAVQVQNSSTFILVVSCGGLQYPIPAFTAATLPINQSQIILDPLYSSGTGAGVIVLGWLQTGESSPVPDGPLVGVTLVVGSINVNSVAASIPFTYAVSGTVQVPSGSAGFLPPQTMPVTGPTTATILGSWVSTRAGTCTLSIEKNGSAIPGLSALAVTDVNTYYAATGSPTFADGDTWSPVVSAASGADGLAVTLIVSFNAS